MKPILHALRVRRLGVALLPLLCGMATAHPDEFDIVVYGGTSGGVTAAVQGARLGKKVALVSPTTHIGGLSASGLGWTDLGDISILGGLSREFYHRIYLYYQGQPNWNTIKTMGGQGGSAFNTTYQTGSIFEPKVAEEVFNTMLAEAGVSVFTGRLDLQSGVLMSGQRITGLRMEDGQTYRGKMFVDACYEGDVMAGAGVSFTLGRESNTTYGETINGVRPGGGHQVVTGVDPYVVKGNPASGLLPGIESTPLETTGTGDHRLQAFCFRMVLTRAANRIPITQPPNYNEQDFEIVLRAVEAGQTAFFKTDGMPNGKTDSNNNGGVSCDYIGRNYGPGWNWATLNHQQRDALAKEHEYWQRGLVYVLQNHARVKAKNGGNGLYTGWGLPADEFTDNGNWAFQLYVREARRMVSDYVMTQKNCTGSVVAADSVGMGAYTMDSHNVRRYVSGGMLRNEGDVQVGTPNPYPISYRSIVPKTGECENLFVPWCLSSSHMAFGSIRMEPVFMALGQSSATAAAMAIDGNISVQQVPYDRLAMKLRADGQALMLNNSVPLSNGVLVDNDDATLVGGWTSSSSVTGYYGTGYLSDDNIGQGTKSVRYTPTLPKSGNYEVQIRWTSHTNRASSVPLKITHKNGIASKTINQQSGGGSWFSLGTFAFDAGTSGNLLLETTNANGYVIADAVQWVDPSGTTPLPTVGIATFVPSVVRGAATGGGFVVTRNGDTDNPLTLQLTVGGSAGASTVSPAIPTSVVIPANARETEIPWLALKGAQPLGAKTLTVTIASNSAYDIGTLSSATATIIDPPFDAWRFARFNSTQLSNANISGPDADPDGNGAPNLVDFFSGDSKPSLLSQDGKLYLSFLRHQDANGMKMKVWESGDMTNWQLTPQLAVPELYETQGDWRKISLPVRASNPFANGQRFFQLRIEN